MPKPEPATGRVSWIADYRVRYDVERVYGRWERSDGEGWHPVAYADVPEDIHAMGRRDGWRFYTMRKSGYRLEADGRKKYFDAADVLPSGDSTPELEYIYLGILTLSLDGRLASRKKSFSVKKGGTIDRLSALHELQAGIAADQGDELWHNADPVFFYLDRRHAYAPED